LPRLSSPAPACAPPLPVPTHTRRHPSLHEEPTGASPGPSSPGPADRRRGRRKEKDKKKEEKGGRRGGRRREKEEEEEGRKRRGGGGRGRCQADVPSILIAAVIPFSIVSPRFAAAKVSPIF
jgi:hypothetical protein